jgi:hypothetical protein
MELSFKKRQYRSIGSGLLRCCRRWFLPWKRPAVSSDGPLERETAEVLDDVRSELRENGCAASDDRIVHFALRCMKRDLNSSFGGEVLEELRTELLYREWCRRNELRPDPVQPNYSPSRPRSRETL